MIKETFTTAKIDIPKPDGSVFRIEIRGALSTEDEQLLRVVEAAPKIYDLLKALLPLVRESVMRELDDGAIGMGGELHDIHAAEALIAELEPKP